MVLVFLCLGGWLPSHHRRDTCNHGAAPMETRWTWLRAADTQAVRELWSLTERAVCHAPIGRPCQLERHGTPDPVRSGAVNSRFHGVPPRADPRSGSRPTLAGWCSRSRSTGIPIFLIGKLD